MFCNNALTNTPNIYAHQKFLTQIQNINLIKQKDTLDLSYSGYCYYSFKRSGQSDNLLYFISC